MTEPDIRLCSICRALVDMTKITFLVASKRGRQTTVRDAQGNTHSLKSKIHTKRHLAQEKGDAEK